MFARHLGEPAVGAAVGKPLRLLPLDLPRPCPRGPRPCRRARRLRTSAWRPRFTHRRATRRSNSSEGRQPPPAVCCRSSAGGTVAFRPDGRAADSYVAAARTGELVAALRARRRAAFTALVERATAPSLLRVAQMFVSIAAVAEEVVQETWLGVLSGIDRFEGRSSLKTWIFRILTNRAKTRGEREGRSVPVLVARRRRAPTRDEPAVDADRFQGAAIRRALDIGAVALVGAAGEPARREGDARRRRRPRSTHSRSRSEP